MAIGVVMMTMTSFAPWLKPTLLGPLLTSWAYMTFGTWLMGTAAITGGTLDDWAIGMVWASAFGCMLGVATVAVDVLLLRARLRRLPTGVRAWASSLLSPLGVVLVLQLPFWGPPETVAGFVAMFAGSMFGGPLLLRLLLGSRP